MPTKDNSWRADLPAPHKWTPGDDQDRRLDAISDIRWPDYYPPLDSRRDNLVWRAKETALSLQNPKRRALHKELCRRDMLYWWAGWCWLYETRSTGEIGTILPFVPYDYQLVIGRELENAIKEASDIATPKSRDMGLTWISLLTLQHRWFFNDGFTALLASIKQEFVDELGSSNTLFEKLRFNLKRQPSWLVPVGFDWKRHSKFLLLINPERRSEIEGTTTTGEVGRAGRYNVVMLDEHAAIPKRVAMEIEGATADAAASRWYVSTPRGDQNLFFQKCHDNRTRRVDVHWHLHPNKGYQAWGELVERDGKLIPGRIRSPWYDYEVANRDQPEWMIAQELDINFSGSIDTLVDPLVLKYWRDTAPEPIETRYVKHRFDGEAALLIWEHPIPGCNYLVCFDPSGGTRTGSHTGGHVLKLPGLEQVAEYEGRLGIDQLKTLAYLLGREYNWAWIAVERNIGLDVLTGLLKGHIDRDGMLGEADARVNAYPKKRIVLYTKRDGTQTDELGIPTTQQTKQFMVYTLLEPTIRNRDCEIKGLRTLSQLAGFREEGIKIHNPDGDDLVMAYNIGLYANRFLGRGNIGSPVPFMVG